MILLTLARLFNGAKGLPPLNYFPLNENDIYIFSLREGSEVNSITITVKNVKQMGKTKEFEFLWSGKYNDRAQLFRSTPDGIVFLENKHLVGEPPLKSIRTHSPPLMMIPYRLKRNVLLSSVLSTRDYKGHLLEQHKIEAEIAFLGLEEVSVEAGRIKCHHFFVHHNYKDMKGKSQFMHTYNFWVAPGIGFVKFIHTFIPFHQTNYINPADKNIMNRYENPFVSLYELKEAIIGGKKIGNSMAVAEN